MNRIMWLICALLLLSGCVGEEEGPEGPIGLPGGVLWRDATDQAVGYGDRSAVLYFDDSGLAWTLHPVTGQMALWSVSYIYFNSADCSGSGGILSAEAIPRVPLTVEDRVLVRAVETPFAMVSCRSRKAAIPSGEGDCREQDGTQQALITLSDLTEADFPLSAAFVSPFYPAPPETREE